MSDLTQRLHRLMSPEAQETNSREFNVTISLLQGLRDDMKGVHNKIDQLQSLFTELALAQKGTSKEVEFLREGLKTNAAKLDRVEVSQRKRPSRWSGSFRPWNGQRQKFNLPEGLVSPGMLNLMKYLGIALGSFVTGVGAFVVAWNQLGEPQPKPPQLPQPVPAHYAPPQSALDDGTEKELRNDESVTDDIAPGNIECRINKRDSQ